MLRLFASLSKEGVRCVEYFFLLSAKFEFYANVTQTHTTLDEHNTLAVIKHMLTPCNRVRDLVRYFEMFDDDAYKSCR